MYIFETYLDVRQHAAHKLPTLPKTLVGVISQEKFKKSRAYSLDKRFISHLLLSFFFSSGDTIQIVLFCLIFFCLLFFQLLPFYPRVCYHTYGLFHLVLPDIALVLEGEWFSFFLKMSSLATLASHWLCVLFSGRYQENLYYTLVSTQRMKYFTLFHF